MDMNGAWSHSERQEATISPDLRIYGLIKVLQNRHEGGLEQSSQKGDSSPGSLSSGERNAGLLY